MEDKKQTSFTFEIDDFSEKEGVILSPQFLSGGCEWYLKVYPKGDLVHDHLSLHLCVANPESLRFGWKTRATHSFILLDQVGKELYRSPQWSGLYCARLTAWGWSKPLTLKELQEKGFLEKDKLILKVEIKVIEVVDEVDVTETLDVCGFHVLHSQVTQVTRIFMEHPDIALNFIPKSQLVKTTYMNLLMGLIDKLNRAPRTFTKNELSYTRMELIDLTKAGFKLDWLKEKLDEISLEWKKENADGSLSSYGSRAQQLEEQVQELEEQVKNLNLELETEKVKSAAEVISLEQTVSKLRDELSKEKGKSTPDDMLEGVVRSWEVLDYADLSNEEVE